MTEATQKQIFLIDLTIFFYPLLRKCRGRLEILLAQWQDMLGDQCSRKHLLASRLVENEISAESSTSRHIYQLNSQDSGDRNIVSIRRRNDDEKVMMMRVETTIRDDDGAENDDGE